MANTTETREVKHKSTISPFECPHCELVWYGSGGSHPSAPDVDLCSQCWHGLEHYLYKHHYKEVSDDAAAVPGYASAWIQDKSMKPLPRAAEKRFHSSVPKWMRSAISQGLVKLNDHEVYVVYSRDQIATRVDVLDEAARQQARLKDVKRRRR